MTPEMALLPPPSLARVLDVERPARTHAPGCEEQASDQWRSYQEGRQTKCGRGGGSRRKLPPWYGSELGDPRTGLTHTRVCLSCYFYTFAGTAGGGRDCEVANKPSLSAPLWSDALGSGR